MDDYKYLIANALVAYLDNEIVDEMADEPEWFFATRLGSDRVLVEIGDDTDTKASFTLTIEEA